MSAERRSKSTDVDMDSQSIGSRLAPLLAVSRAVVSGGTLKETLDEVARQAKEIAGAEKAAILELTGDNHFRVVGNCGLDEDYVAMIADSPGFLRRGVGPSGVAVAEERPVVIEDLRHDVRFRDWSISPMRDRWRAVAAFPLITNDEVLGTLVLYRLTPRSWDDDEVRLLTFVAEHAAITVKAAQLFDEQHRQVTALERLVQSLRAQSHEHANRLHTIAGFLAMGESKEALAFIESVGSASLIDRRWLGDDTQSALTALLAVESGLARQRSIALEVDSVQGLEDTAMTDAQAVTIIGNALDNAFDAVADMPDDRRRVEVCIFRAGGWVEISVRDWGPGLPEWMGDPFARGASGKPGHSGIGLLLAREAAIAAYGEVQLERLPDGTRVVARLPIMARRSSVRKAGLGRRTKVPRDRS